MTEIELNATETKHIYETICAIGIEPFQIEFDKKSSDLYYDVDGKQYRLVYDRDCDWFLDIAYRGEYK